jgi:hypothetical protein
VRNRHKFPLSKLIIQDAVPLAPSESEGRGVPHVILRGPPGLADAKDGDVLDVKEGVKVRWGEKGGVKEGKITWIAELAAGADIELETKYEVKGPAEMTWVLKQTDV